MISPTLRLLLAGLLTFLITFPAAGQAPNISQDAAKRAAQDAVERAANRRYRVGVGASFDFLNGLSATDLYGDVTIRIPAVIEFWGLSVGFDGGLYNGRATTFRETRQLDLEFESRGVPHPDSMTVVTQIFTRTAGKHTDNLTLFFGPTFRLSKHVALAGHAELHRQELVTTTTFKTISLDTVVQATDGLPNRGPQTVLQDTTRITRLPRYGAFFGVGPLLNFDDADYNLWHKPLLGIEVIDGRIYGAYAVPFRLTDYDHGFKLGGEVRGRLNFRGQPTIAVFLARDFSLGRLADFLVGGDGDDDGEPGDTGPQSETTPEASSSAGSAATPATPPPPATQVIPTTAPAPPVTP